MKYFCCILAMLYMNFYLYGSEMSVTQLNVVYEEKFNSFTGTLDALPDGFWVSIDGTNLVVTTNDFRGVSDGGEVTGGCYAWDTGEGNLALGCQPTEAKFSPGFFLLSVLNLTGVGVNEISVLYDVVCLNNADRSSSMSFEFSLDGVSFQRIDAMTFVSPAEQERSTAWFFTPYACNISFPEKLTGGAQIWLRWYLDDAGGSASRDEYGIDNFRIIFHYRAGTVISIY